MIKIKHAPKANVFTLTLRIEDMVKLYMSLDDTAVRDQLYESMVQSFSNEDTLETYGVDRYTHVLNLTSI